MGYSFAVTVYGTFCYMPTVVVMDDEDWGEIVQMYWDEEEWYLLLP